MYIQRKKYRIIKAAVILIQRWIRGHLARRRFALMKKERYTTKNLRYFDYQARIIQKYYRGYYSRMYVHDFYARSNYRKFLIQKNQQTLQQLKRYNKQQQEFVQKNNQEQARAEFKNIVKNLHHLKSTSNIPGIYNSPYNQLKPNAFGIDIETHLQSTFHANYKWRAPNKNKITYYKRTLPPLRRKYNFPSNPEVQKKMSPIKNI